MQLNLPKQYPFMGGVEPGFAPSADGSFFFSAWIHDGPRGGGQYVFRQATAKAQAVEVNYGPLMTGRGHLCLGGDGILYLTGSDGAAAMAYVVPGYVRYTSAGPLPVPITVIQAVTDADARRLAQDASTLAKAASKDAEHATAALKNYVPVSDSHIADIAWSKIPDGIFAQIQNPNSPLASFVWQKALDSAFSLLKQHGLIQ